MVDFRSEYLADMVRQFDKLRNAGERAIAQVGDDDFTKVIDPESNSIAITVKHISGNLRSRFADFLTSDGEKPTRDRDSEFLLSTQDTRTHLLNDWAAAWELLAATVRALTLEDLQRTIYIRAEPHTVGQALNRHLSHVAYHVGQIVLLAKHWVGADWRTLSIARGQSKVFTQTMKERLSVHRTT